MTAAILKLESFDRPPVAQPTPEQAFDRDDLDQAFADGFAAGKAEADEAQMSRLETCVAQLSELLREDEARRDALRGEAVAALSPILTHILDLMAPASQSRRLEETLLAELVRIAGRSSPLKARITCAPPLLGMVQRCLEQVTDTPIEIDCREDAELSIRLEGGRIDICPDRAGREIAALIAEINEENQEWTH
ncbi:hypothetical protein [Paracoccus tibetensis]|uniref:Flagellar assembly protein FliH n=1 Tax=Paracoccus tibetensis TaxID=336292 RepID=A0A1G5IIW1_9RHOB|nr:hypothetical protein [Paracoccus tibetensis]SCY75954.1 hypothetical protein SAMN05660710_02635 [Paracoccus tibetensis]